MDRGDRHHIALNLNIPFQYGWNDVFKVAKVMDAKVLMNFNPIDPL